MELSSNPLAASQTPGSGKDLRASSFLPYPLEKFLVRSLAGDHPLPGPVSGSPALEMARYALSRKDPEGPSWTLRSGVDLAGMIPSDNLELPLGPGPAFWGRKAGECRLWLRICRGQGPAQLLSHPWGCMAL